MSKRGSIHLHGHVHGGLQEQNKGRRRFDVGVEIIDYTPISIDEIIRIVNERNS
jgi:calcineurin-like phosphoesterase family protein